ncbi:MAG: metallophosphoesterase [Lachnospiraceae bacterium]|nr:metallophosphoesterase [Lachnospiraceae bacterium]
MFEKVRQNIMATYVIGDIHNQINQLDRLIKLISPALQDRIFLLGDLFDRGGADPDPVGVYHRISGLNTNVKWIRGNHDQLLAEYIYAYYETDEKKRGSLRPYRYNSFDLMKDRLTRVDMLDLADLIMRLPLQVEIGIGSVKYLLAHAMTFDPSAGEQEENAYLEGLGDMHEYWEHGVKGYISLVGHQDTGYQYSNPKGRYLDERSDSIWLNEAENVYMMDCGCGLPNGRLACICLETGERFYA